ncbi:hypothetical protein HK405_004955 [Cladochytrium tenue]|nr:hypothetical protein HK405_004955 [Cladochytrium tenue]
MYEALEFQIEQACDPKLANTHLQRCLEICDLVNQKQQGYPRRAVYAVAKLINSSDQEVAAGAISLLDILVKNCGYPVQLLVSSKEFLNLLVRRFPDRPSGGNLIQYRILELIEQWNSTICVTSRYKDDFKHITDMYRLLSYKGYRFPGVSGDAAAVLTASEMYSNRMNIQSLKTEEELEDEDKIAQGAKLQELLRIGTPAALEQANDLMKVMAGYDMQHRPNYKKQVNEELDKIEAKVILLNDILGQDTLQSTSTLDELSGAVKSSQSRIQKLISGGEEEERMSRLLELNDLINTVLANHKEYRAGRKVTSVAIQPSREAGSPSGPSSSSSPSTTTAAAAGVINLIDFDDSTIPDSSPYSVSNFRMPGTTSVAAPVAFNQAAGLTAAPPAAVTAATAPVANLIDDISGLDFFGASGQAVAATRPATMAATGASQFVPLAASTPAAFSATAGLPPVLSMSTVVSSTASAAASPLKPSSPPASSPPSTVSAYGSDILEALGGTSPVLSKPVATEAYLFNKNGLQIKFSYSALVAPQSGWKGQLTFLNTTPVDFTDLTFQLAVPKTMNLSMLPLTGTFVPALNQGQVFQSIHVTSASSATELRLKFKVGYKVNGAQVEEAGDFVHK